VPVYIDLALMDRTLRIRYRDQIGSALYAEIDGVKLIFTAAHIVAGMAVGDSIGIRFQSDWHLVEVEGIERCSIGYDVAAIRPKTQWGEGWGVDQMKGGMAIGQEVAYCGFPLSLEMYGMPGALGWPKGFVKAGIFSGVRAREDGLREFLFDTINNAGFSGGPIAVRRNGKLHVIAIVSGYKYDAPSPVYRSAPGQPLEPTADYVVLPNSGFMVGVGIDRAIECGRLLVAPTK
jgi:hypothetical protein